MEGERERERVRSEYGIRKIRRIRLILRFILDDVNACIGEYLDVNITGITWMCPMPPPAMPSQATETKAA